MKCCEWGPWGRARTRGRTYVGPERRFDVENDDANENEDDKFKHFFSSTISSHCFQNRQLDEQTRRNTQQKQLARQKKGANLFFLRQLKLLKFVVNQIFNFSEKKTFYFHFFSFFFSGTKSTSLTRLTENSIFFSPEKKSFSTCSSSRGCSANTELFAGAPSTTS